jgi:MFS family permease
MNKLKTYKLYELKSFLILWAGQSVSSLGSEMTKYALIVWAYTQLGTVSSITWLAVCSYLPSIVFCFAAGALADKWDKKESDAYQ